MKKILILIVTTAIYLHFFPQPELEQFYQEKKASLLNSLSKSTKVGFKANLNGFVEGLTDNSIGFSPEEVNELKAISSSVESLTGFYQETCINKHQQGSGFHSDNINKVCQQAKSFINKL